MKIVSTTLAGPGTARIIRDALQSADPLVDETIVILTDIAASLEWSSLGCAGYLYPQIVGWAWRDDFGAARNASLDFAQDTGADWAIMVDTDERLICPSPAAVRAFLVALPPEVVVVIAFSSDGASGRERFFRLPAKHRWIGRTHEAFPVDVGEQAIIPAKLIMWDDVPKTADQLRAKNERDAVLLEAEIAEHPDDMRWYFYRGAALAGLGRHEEAIESYRQAADRGRGEDAAMACARAAEILVHEKRYEEAVAACARGMTIRADIAELPWIAAGASINMGERHQAEAWALLAKVHGEAGAGKVALTRRVGFRNIRALREGPDEILRMARPAPVALEPDANPIRITVTSSAIRAEGSAVRCIRSVAKARERARHAGFPLPGHVYAAADEDTIRAATHAQSATVVDGRGRGLLANLLPIWRSLPDDEVIVWLDGDDWLATDRALEAVAEMHAAGALVTYGQFIWDDGRMGFCAPVEGPPRWAPWTCSHLKTFRAWLVKRIRDEDLRGPDGEYLALAIDQAVMLPLLEMAEARAVFCPRILAVYNSAHSFEATATEAERSRESATVAEIRTRPRYGRYLGG